MTIMCVAERLIMKTEKDDVDMTLNAGSLKVAAPTPPGPAKVLLYGVEGVGKTTLAAQFPAPLFLDLEGSTVKMKPQPARMDDVGGFKELKDQLNQIYNTPHQYKTLVIDSVSVLDNWVEDFVIERAQADNANINSIEDFGYGKGYTIVEEEIRKFLDGLDALIKKRQMHIVLIAHSIIRQAVEPGMSASYDRYELNLSKKVAPTIKQWADAVLFARYHDIIIENKDGTKAKGVRGKDRVLYCNHTATIDAKNRFGLPDVVPMTIDSLKPLFQ